MVYGLISEFNPFHNGHKWLIEQVKGEENTVITVMSGSFVQRGDISIINKYDKARASLQNGVDLVIELPAVYSLANAEIFAKSAVSILDKTGVTDRLFFGSECGDIDVINNALDIINNQNVQAKIKENMNKGLYYPKAVYNSIKELYNEETA
ncbi:MAG: nucleotidyltransferase family protein, partial [Ruminococcus sp.]|nr:nucleotidyltransferase family protein [Ruminococcus sp.]